MESLARKWCPVWVASQDGHPREDATAAYAQWQRLFQGLQKRGAEKMAKRDEHEVVPSRVAASSNDPQGSAHAGVRRLLGSYVVHKVITIGGNDFCIACFSKAPRYRQPQWRQQPCDGWLDAHQAPATIAQVVMLQEPSTTDPKVKARLEAIAEAGRRAQHAGESMHQGEWGALEPARKRRRAVQPT